MNNLPYFIELELTNICYLSCIMCPHKIMKRPQGIMSFETLKKVIDELKGHSKESYLHQIGEPLLYPYLIKAINYVAKAGIKTSISTNCLYLNRDMTDKILKSSLHEIILCIDSLKKENYEKIRVNSDFQKVLYNIEFFLKEKELRKSKIYVQVQLIKMQENKDEWDLFNNYFKTKGVDKVWIKDYSTFAGKVTKGEQVEPRRFTCAKPFTHLTVQWNGDCVTCCRDFDGITRMGNVNEQSIYSIWNSEKYNNFRKNFRELEFCKEC